MLRAERSVSLLSLSHHTERELERKEGEKDTAEVLREYEGGGESERKGVHSLLITHSSSLVLPDLNQDPTVSQ